ASQFRIAVIDWRAAGRAIMSEGTLKANSYGNLLFRPLYWLGVAVWFLFKVLLTAWGTLAIYHSNLPWFGLRLALAAGFAAFSIWALWLARRNSAWLAFAAVFAAVVGWWLTITPSHDRAWRPEVAVMPRAFIDGDRVRITGVRNFEYRSETDFTVRHEEREYRLSRLTGL